jgi:ABC-type antimicrobial peptide transport system permease subunit
MALGADRRNILKLILGQGGRLALIGIAAGLAGAIVLSKWISSMLFGVRPTDPLTLAAMALIQLGVVLLACYIPARRAMNVDPLTALKQE